MATISEQALAAYAQQKSIEEHDAQKRKQTTENELRAAFVKFFGREPDAVDGVHATVDGCRFWIHPETYQTRFRFRVQGTCPACHKPAWSDALYSLADLGRELMDFHVAFDDYAHRHWTQPSEGEKSLGEQLQELILEIVRQNSPSEI